MKAEYESIQVEPHSIAFVLMRDAVATACTRVLSGSEVSEFLDVATNLSDAMVKQYGDSYSE